VKAISVVLLLVPDQVQLTVPLALGVTVTELFEDVKLAPVARTPPVIPPSVSTLMLAPFATVRLPRVRVEQAGSVDGVVNDRVAPLVVPTALAADAR
jgi:hypothetical protein